MRADSVVMSRQRAYCCLRCLFYAMPSVITLRRVSAAASPPSPVTTRVFRWRHAIRLYDELNGCYAAVTSVSHGDDVVATAASPYALCHATIRNFTPIVALAPPYAAASVYALAATP